MKKRKRLWIAAAVLLALILGVAAYAGDYYRAEEAAAAAMAGSDSVMVEQRGNLTAFIPESPEAGFVFYPGGKVEHTAYAPLMLALAEEDILCVLVKMPLNLAVLDMDAAKGIPQQFPEVEHWYIGGHSLGGSMAASYVSDHAEDFDGLVLLAAYSTADLRSTDLEVLLVRGDRDGVLNMEKYGQYMTNLPERSKQLVISGGNHARFGSYGPQEGDGEASISGGEQLDLTAASLLEFMNY